MARSNMNAAYSRSRLRLQRRRQLLLMGGIGLAALVVLIVLLVTLLGGHGGRDRYASASNATAEPTQAPDTVALEEVEAEPTATPKPKKSSGERTAEQRAKTRPTATAEGFMPVFWKADTTEKIVAITVDDCNQVDNLQQIVDKAIEVGGKLTIFPIGQNVRRESVGKVLKYAYENGFELENHTFTHNGLYKCSNTRLAQEVYGQQLALCELLGKEYQPHFLRPAGGDARHDQRMQMYVKQLGYYGIAHWSASGAASKATLAKALEPGAIYLFHTKDEDREKLLDFIPWVVKQGYKLVTLNEMFGYPENETSELKTSIEKHKVPKLKSYKRVYTPLKKTTYSYYAYMLQAKLIKLGYLKGKPDGVYGKGCEEAVKKYQKDHKLKVTGVADAKLLKKLLG